MRGIIILLSIAIVVYAASFLGVISEEPAIFEKVKVSTEITTEYIETTEAENTNEWYTVERVVDGDTFVIDTGEKVRMILINSPESVHSDKSKNTEFGKIASDYTKKLIEGQKVKLVKDVTETDRYGRLLRYVYLEDGTFLNEHLVREGYAQIATYPPDVKYKDAILAAEKHARENKKGLWGD